MCDRCHLNTILANVRDTHEGGRKGIDSLGRCSPCQCHSHFEITNTIERKRGGAIVCEEEEEETLKNPLRYCENELITPRETRNLRLARLRW